jgi:hypothetical protein
MSRDTKRVSRWGLFIPLIIAGLLIAAYTAFWFVARGKFEQLVDERIATERAAGAEISFKSKSIGGYPFRLALDLTDPKLARPNGVQFEGQRVQAIVQPWNPGHVMIRAPGLNRLTNASGVTHSFDLRGASVASVALDKGALSRFALKLDDADLIINGKAYKTDDLTVNMAPQAGRKDDLLFSINWNQLEVERVPRDAPYLGKVLGPSQFSGEVRGFFPALAAAGGDVGGVLRKLGGVSGAIELAPSHLAWGPMHLGLKSDLDFAGGKGATGAIGVRLEDADQLRDAMKQAGYWDGFTQLMLMPVEQSSENGGYLEMQVENNQVILNGSAVMSLPGAGG